MACERWSPSSVPLSAPAPRGAGPSPMATSTADAHRRQEKLRQLDARRSKCRIHLGRHMEQACLLKEWLGFSLHSQLAKFLLNQYTSSGCVFCAGPKPLPLKGLQYLFLLSHAHSQECSLVLGLQGAWGSRWWACVGVLSRSHLLLEPLFRPHTSSGV